MEAHARAPAKVVMPEGPVVTKAVMRAAKSLGISNKHLASVIGVSEPTVSRMGNGGYTLAPGDKPFELSVLLLRLYRSLDAIVGGDEDVAKQWIRNDNNALGAVPLDMIQNIIGLTNVIAYLDTRRATI